MTVSFDKDVTAYCAKWLAHHLQSHLLWREIVLIDLNVTEEFYFENKLFDYLVWLRVLHAAYRPFSVACEELVRLFTSLIN
jgi:hypothetical protein